jgi:hypothetical protein
LNACVSGDHRVDTGRAMSQAKGASIASIFDTYLLALRKTPVDHKTEHTDRGAMEALLQALAATQNPDTRIQHEPKRNAKGAPDFKVQNHASIVGYVENKKIGENLDKILKSEQIVKYQTLSHNIIVNDYLQWVWLRDGKIVAREVLCYESDLENRKVALKADRVKAVSDLILGFLSVAPEGVGRASELALALATRAHWLRDYLAEELDRQQRDKSQDRLFGLYEAFKTQVFQDLTLNEFADAFAQTLAYGLFLAALNAEKDIVTLRTAPDYVPGSFQLIRELVEFLPLLNSATYTEIKWVVEEILAIVNTMDVAAIHEDLSFRSRKASSQKMQAQDEEEWRLFSKDPFIYFYEDFLGKYDAKLKKSRGVYYTPPPIVNFIVRAIDDILKDTFGIADGLADHKRVTVLDFACGTGTFLVEVLERIFDTIGPDSGKRDLIIKEHILKNIFGFEYLIAPYTIAHLKLSQYLNERQYKLAAGERIQVYLTNTLEPISPQKNFTLPELTRETEAAQSIKDKPILVITGNPPYSGHSKNKGKWITGLIEDYRKGFPELKKPGQGKWLQDDYVKFIRFAQWKMSAVDEGIVALITNHSFLDNPTFKGMRKSLSESFNRIYLLDLHGSTKRNSYGKADENVFDIEQGVAISLFVKTKKYDDRIILRYDLNGSRQKKYVTCSSLTMNEMIWKNVKLTAPYFLFQQKNDTIFQSYENFFRITEMFFSPKEPAPGLVTTHDDFAISFTKEDAIRKVNNLISSKTESDARKQYKLCKQSQWSYEKAKSELSKTEWISDLIKINYRPFDIRWTFYNRNISVHLRKRTMQYMTGGENYAILTSRQVKSGIDWHQVFLSNLIVESSCISNKTSEIGYIFPLFRTLSDEEMSEVDLFYRMKPRNRRKIIENFKSEFRSFIDQKYNHHFLPEEIFGYIYAILHAPTYRTVFAEFLRLDFPRIPFVESKAKFETLSALGWDLAQKHLLKEVPKLGLGAFLGKGDYQVEKPVYADAEQAVFINKTQHFKPVPRVVWEFHIGGYQVIDKYLKSRKGRTLSLDEIENVANVCNVLQFTIHRMAEIDALYRVAFPDHGLNEE